MAWGRAGVGGNVNGGGEEGSGKANGTVVNGTVPEVRRVNVLATGSVDQTVKVSCRGPVCERDSS